MRSKEKSTARFLIELVIICIISLAFIIGGNSICSYDQLGSAETGISSARVVKITDIRSEILDGMNNTVIDFDAEFVTGDARGQIVQAQQIINEMTIDKPKPVEEGDRVLISDSNLTGSVQTDASWYFLQQNRIFGMIVLAGIFLVLLLIIGRMKGLTTIVALGFTGAAVFAVYIPAILSGMNIYAVTIIITVFIIFASLSLLNGINKKTLCAIVGNMGGILVAGVMAVFVNKALKITGLVDEGFVYLMADDSGSMLDLRAIVWSCIIIGSLGAIMDVSMSIASAMQELAYEMKDRSFGRMVKSGMNIGRDAIGTMTITLVLAYAGSSIASILLFMLNSRNIMILMNFEMVVVEVIQAIIGSMGILLAVPITVFFAGWVFNKGKSIDLQQ
ncbi:MAG: YibE/F family protein [Firmicutes bacterium]|nr:YibE/F family protein [Bacillota bacterium]